MTKFFKFWVNGTRKVHPDDDKAIPWTASTSERSKTQFLIEFLDRTQKSPASRQKKFPSCQKKFP